MKKPLINDLKYFLIKEFMQLNGFEVLPEDANVFTRDTLTVSIVQNEQKDTSFMILSIKGESLEPYFTGDLNLATLLGYLLWHRLIENYQIPKA